MRVGIPRFHNELKALVIYTSTDVFGAKSLIQTGLNSLNMHALARMVRI